MAKRRARSTRPKCYKKISCNGNQGESHIGPNDDPVVRFEGRAAVCPAMLDTTRII